MTYELVKQLKTKQKLIKSFDTVEQATAGAGEMSLVLTGKSYFGGFLSFSDGKSDYYIIGRHESGLVCSYK